MLLDIRSFIAVNRLVDRFCRPASTTPPADSQRRLATAARAHDATAVPVSIRQSCRHAGTASGHLVAFATESLRRHARVGKTTGTLGMQQALQKTVESGVRTLSWRCVIHVPAEADATPLRRRRSGEPPPVIGDRREGRRSWTRHDLAELHT